MATSTKTHSPADTALRDFEALSRRDADGMAATYAPDATVDMVPIGILRGADAVRTFFSELFAAIPDLETTYEVVGVGDATAVVEWRMHGTFSGGPFQGLEPTGKAIENRGVDVMRIEDDRIVHNTAYYDALDFARKVGMMPPQDSAAERAMIGAFNAVTKLRTRVAAKR